MLNARLFTLTAAVAALAAGIAGAAEEKKEARWKASGPYYAVVNHASETTTNTMGEEKVKKSKDTYVYQVTQAERKGGGWDVELVLKRVTGDDPELDLWRKGLDVPVTLEFDANMVFLKTRGMEKLVEKLGEDEESTEAERKVQADLLKQGLMEFVGEAFVTLPTAKPTTAKRAGGLAGFLTAKTEFQFAAPKPEKDGTLAYGFSGASEFAIAEDQSALPFTLVKLDEKKAVKPTGTLWFDPVLGRPARISKTQDYAFGMTMSVDGQTFEMSFADKSELDVRFVAKMPREDK